MKTYRTNENAPYGVYVSLRGLDIQVVDGEEEALTGRPNATYRRIPMPLLILLSPVIGGAFVLLFPVLVLMAIAMAAGNALARLVRPLSQRYAHLARPRFEPAAAFLESGDEGDTPDGKPQASHPSEELDELEEEVSARRLEEQES